ncbi:MULTISPECIES: hypothetical protein [unclassified Variovorax]|uniref:hypothetical protein n=1 Tax=unclassified Variovorax TaxID=663243 RepID=UPI00076C201E|nr:MULTISPECIES: hypothetical protein [unclassified Variovorax]KWT98501.1 hypothetical protein APY03_0636 [Variovorax sp. WDL1]PNG49822.1 hypothetical protein CHC06_05403 [Variovorax sp. B2]PNG50694.1 hypothetical protein CHC07_05308 [Variovorax sp. B4]VTV17887.1 hypothetical protein WDL1P1_00741 [Variovorax sp. WDL1]
MKDIILFPLYALAGAYSYLLTFVWTLLSPVLGRFYRSEVQYRIFAVLAKSRLGPKSMALLALGAPILLGSVWPRMPVWFVNFGLLSIVYMALLHALSRPSGMFHVHIVGRRKLEVHMRAARPSDGPLRAQLAQLEDVVALAKRCGAESLTMDSPLLVDTSAYAFVENRLRELCADAGLELAFRLETPRARSAAVTGLFAPYRRDYARLRFGRVVWASRLSIMSRRVEFRLY